MANWADLQIELLILIAKRVKRREDFIHFRAVCSSWRSAASREHFDSRQQLVPLLMLADKGDDYRKFYSVSRQKVSSIFLPEVKGRDCFPTQGWICTVAKTGEMNLLHPFSRTQIQLPPKTSLKIFERRDMDRLTIEKVVLSASPSVTSNYVVVVMFLVPGCNYLNYWRPGDLDWTYIEVITEWETVCGQVWGRSAIFDINYCNGQLYCYTCYNKVFVLDFAGPADPHQKVEPRLVLQFEEDDPVFNAPDWRADSYLVEVSGTLYIVARYLLGKKGVSDDLERQVSRFRVFELDVTAGELKEIKNLGFAMFVDLNASIPVSPSKFSRVKPNHIYFGCDWHGRIHLWTYNLGDGQIERVESFYPGYSPKLVCYPSWVMPSF